MLTHWKLLRDETEEIHRWGRIALVAVFGSLQQYIIRPELVKQPAKFTFQTAGDRVHLLLERPPMTAIFRFGYEGDSSTAPGRPFCNKFTVLVFALFVLFPVSLLEGDGREHFKNKVLKETDHFITAFGAGGDSPAA